MSAETVREDEAGKVQVWFEKGQRARLRVTQWKLPGESWSIAGAQMKVLVERFEITGLITHVRGNAPVNPTEVGIFIVDDADDQEKVVNTKWITYGEVLS